MATASVQPLLHPLLSTVYTIIGADDDLKGLVDTIIGALSKTTTSGNTIIQLFCDKYLSQNGMPSNIGEVKLFLNYVRFCNPPKKYGDLYYDEAVLDHYFNELLDTKFIKDLEALSPGASKELSIRSSLAFKFNNEICYERTSLLKLDIGYSGGAPASATGRGRGRGRGGIGGRGGRGGRGRGGGTLKLTYDLIDKSPYDDSRNPGKKLRSFTSKICSFLWEEVVAVSCPQIGFDIIASIHLPNLGDILIRDTTGTFVSIEVKATTDYDTKRLRLSKADNCDIGLTGLALDPSKLVAGKLNVGIEQFEILSGTKPKQVNPVKEPKVKLECGKFVEFKDACTIGLCAAGVYNSQFLNAGRTEISSFEDLIENDPNLKLSFKPTSCAAIPSSRTVIQIKPRTFLLAPSSGMPTPGGGGAAASYVPPHLRRGKGPSSLGMKKPGVGPGSFAMAPSFFTGGPSSSGMKKPGVGPGSSGMTKPGGGAAFATKTKKYIAPSKRAGHTAPGGGTGAYPPTRTQRIKGTIKNCCKVDFNGDYYGFIKGYNSNDYYFKLSYDPRYIIGTVVSFKPNPPTSSGKSPIATDIRVEPRFGKIKKSKKKNKRRIKRKNTNKRAKKQIKE